MLQAKIDKLDTKIEIVEIKEVEAKIQAVADELRDDSKNEAEKVHLREETKALRREKEALREEKKDLREEKALRMRQEEDVRTKQGVLRQFPVLPLF
jgi:hypothetical protein